MTVMLKDCKTLTETGLLTRLTSVRGSGTYIFVFLPWLSMVTRAVPLKTNLLYVLNVFALSFNSKLQSVVLQQQSFLQKCETWMEFLSQTEQKLTAEISGNYQSLLEQQRDHEVRGSIQTYTY